MPETSVLASHLGAILLGFFIRGHFLQISPVTECPACIVALRQHHQEQSKRTTSQKSPFTWEFRMKMPQTKTGAYTLCEPSPSKCTWTSQKSPFTREFRMKMPQTKTEARTLCVPAQANCIRTCHKSHLMREFSAKMPRPRKRTLISCRPQQDAKEQVSIFHSRLLHVLLSLDGLWWRGHELMNLW